MRHVDQLRRYLDLQLWTWSRPSGHAPPWGPLQAGFWLPLPAPLPQSFTTFFSDTLPLASCWKHSRIHNANVSVLPMSSPILSLGTQPSGTPSLPGLWCRLPLPNLTVLETTLQRGHRWFCRTSNHVIASSNTPLNVTFWSIMLSFFRKQEEKEGKKPKSQCNHLIQR